MSIKLIKTKEDIQVAINFLKENFEQDKNMLASSIIFQSINGYHLSKIDSLESECNVLAKCIRKYCEESNLQLIWNDLKITQKAYQEGILQRIYLFSLFKLSSGRKQSIDFFSVDSMKSIHNLETKAIFAEDGLLHIIDL